MLPCTVKEVLLSGHISFVGKTRLKVCQVVLLLCLFGHYFGRGIEELLKTKFSVHRRLGLWNIMN